METNNEAVGQAVPLSMTQEQLDAAIESRLNRLKQQHAAELARKDAELEAIRTEATNRVNEAKGTPSTITQHLEAERAKRAAEDLERQDLSVYFGPSSSGTAASRLMKESPEKYAVYKKRAQELGLIHTPQAPENRGGAHRVFSPIAQHKRTL